MNAITSQQAENKLQLIKASEAWSTAFYEGDAMTMDNLEHQGVIIIEDGVIGRKAQPRTKSSWTPSNVKSHTKVFEKVHLLNDIGLLIGNLNLEINKTETLVFTEIWKKQSGQWLVFAAHFSSQKL